MLGLEAEHVAIGPPDEALTDGAIIAHDLLARADHAYLPGEAGADRRFRAGQRYTLMRHRLHEILVQVAGWSHKPIERGIHQVQSQQAARAHVCVYRREGARLVLLGEVSKAFQGDKKR